jgi:hypothetical protein
LLRRFMRRFAQYIGAIQLPKKNGVVAKLVNATVCKTVMRRFDPGLRLQQLKEPARVVEW